MKLGKQSGYCLSIFALEVDVDGGVGQHRLSTDCAELFPSELALSETHARRIGLPSGSHLGEQHTPAY